MEQVPVFIDVISLQKDSFTDGGFRFRKNDLHVKDHVLGLEKKHLEFVDYEFFNLDTYSKKGWDYSDPDYDGMQHRQAELWFRNADSKIVSTLKIKTFVDLFTDIAGVPFIFMNISLVFIGAY